MIDLKDEKGYCKGRWDKQAQCKCINYIPSGDVFGCLRISQVDYLKCNHESIKETVKL